MFSRRVRDISVQEVTYKSKICQPEIYNLRDLIIKCTSVNELTQTIANDFLNKTTCNWQGKANFHYFFRIIINIPLHSMLLKKFRLVV